jgi:uncharacterized membrane protein YedE/YeeE
VSPLFEVGAFGAKGALLAALFIGVAFGFFLERGGMGDARKLAGQFYLTDLAVFKVLFTAVVTAMLGLFWLVRLGVVEPSLVHVPETFVVPQIVGGLVFGVGFVMGGLCPGTSCVAAASGRLDGLALMAGMFFGVLVFAELYPLLQGFHGLTPRGVWTLPEAFGLPAGVVVFGVTLVAVLGFRVAERIEGAGGGVGE